MITTVCIVNCHNCYLTIVKPDIAVNKIDIPYRAILKAQINYNYIIAHQTSFPTVAYYNLHKLMIGQPLLTSVLLVHFALVNCYSGTTTYT